MASKRLRKKKQAAGGIHRQQTVQTGTEHTEEKTAVSAAAAEDVRTETCPQAPETETKVSEEAQTGGVSQEVCFQIEVNLQEEKEEMKQMNFYVQWNGKEFCQADIVEKITAQWERRGNTKESLETLNIYLKPEESKAYYVANGSVQGSVDL